MSTIPKRNSICAVIPFYNEKESLAGVISCTLPHVDHLILVDDGSTDGTQNIIPLNEKIILIAHPQNLGKGAALKSGLIESIKRGFDISITLDADMQHPPDDIPKFISELKKYDVVVGNRLSSLGNMPLQRIASNKLTSLLLSLKTKIKLPDTQCGFRGYRNNVLENILPNFSGYEAESEMLINASRSNCRIGFVTIPTIYANEKSKMKPVKTIIGFLRVLFI